MTESIRLRCAINPNHFCPEKCKLRILLLDFLKEYAAKKGKDLSSVIASFNYDSQILGQDLVLEKIPEIVMQCLQPRTKQ